MKLERSLAPDGGGNAAALDYSLKRWSALSRFLAEGAAGADNNHIENLVHPRPPDAKHGCPRGVSWWVNARRW